VRIFKLPSINELPVDAKLFERRPPGTGGVKAAVKPT
jgi:hypothetical protein